MDLLFLENEDSFTWNVIDLLPVPRERVRVLSGRGVTREQLAQAEALVIGPGPTDPVRAGLVEIVRAAAEMRIPTLGVCLGHQALGLAFGARLRRTPPVHGKASSVAFRASRSFAGIEGPVEVMRYHSLSLDAVAAPLRVVAETADGLPMAIEHEALPMAGVQFHPDSYATPRGVELVAAWFRSIA